MPPTAFFPGVYALALGPVNVFFVEDGPHLTLIDTGYEHSEERILEAAQSLGKRPTDITNIVVTHCHPDHAGSLAALKEQTQAVTWMHRADAEVVRGNSPMGGAIPSPGLLNQILYRIFIKSAPPHVPKAAIDHEIGDGDVLPLGGGLRAVHTPGHSAGHLAFVLQREGGLLFAADACSNLPMLGYSIVYEDLAEGRRSLAKLAALDVSGICFGHGRPLKGTGVQRFKRKWHA